MNEETLQMTEHKLKLSATVINNYMPINWAI